MRRYRELSDGNTPLGMACRSRRSFARTARFNLDLGVSAYMLETAHDLNHGYYDPRRYEHYAITAYPVLQAARERRPGADGSPAVCSAIARPPAFHFGGTVSGEATFGIYEPWVLKVERQRHDEPASRQRRVPRRRRQRVAVRRF